MKLSKEQWKVLADLKKQIDEHEGEFYAPSSTKTGNRITYGGVNESPVVANLRQAFYKNDLMIKFEWPNWDEGREIFRRKDEDKFNDINLEDSLKLFTAVIRNDRFNDGALGSLFESGDAKKLIDHILNLKTTN